MATPRSLTPSRFEALLVAQAPAVTRRLRALVGERETAEDLCQEALARAWRAAPRDGDPVRLRAWLLRTARNLAVDELRRRARRDHVALADDVAAAPAERDPRAREALAALSAHQRLLLLLRFEAGLSLRELGDALDIGEEAARKRVARARRAFVAAHAELTAGDRRPTVAVVLGRDDGEAYRGWLDAAGARVRMLERERPGIDLVGVDAVVLTGSETDIHPALYGQRRGPHIQDPDRYRDERDLAILRAALRSATTSTSSRPRARALCAGRWAPRRRCVPAITRRSAASGAACAWPRARPTGWSRRSRSPGAGSRSACNGTRSATAVPSRRGWRRRWSRRRPDAGLDDHPLRVLRRRAGPRAAGRARQREGPRRTAAGSGGRRRALGGAGDRARRIDRRSVSPLSAGGGAPARPRAGARRPAGAQAAAGAWPRASGRRVHVQPHVVDRDRRAAEALDDLVDERAPELVGEAAEVGSEVDLGEVAARVIRGHGALLQPRARPREAGRAEAPLGVLRRGEVPRAAPAVEVGREGLRGHRLAGSRVDLGDVALAAALRDEPPAVAQVGAQAGGERPPVGHPVEGRRPGKHRGL